MMNLLLTGTEKRMRVFMLAVCMVFFFGFLLTDGPHLAADSTSYIHMHYGLNPGYPLFLALCRALPYSHVFMFQNHPGLIYATIIQNLLWVVATYRVAIEIKGIMSGFLPKKLADVCGICALLLQFSVTLLNRFFTPRHAMYSNHILTEALSMPLFLLFLIALYRLLFTADRSDFLLSFVYAFLLIEIRKQMIIVLAIWGAMALLYHILHHHTRNIRRFTWSILLILLAFACGKLVDRWYYDLTFGKAEKVPGGGTSALFTMMLYISNDDTASLFNEDEEDLREIFLDMNHLQKEYECHITSYDGAEGLLGLANHFANSHDKICITLFPKVLNNHTQAGTFASESEETRYRWEAGARLTKVLMRQSLLPLARVYVANIVCGLVYSIARPISFLPIYALFMYLLFLFLLFFCKKNNADKLYWFALLTLLSIIVNVLTVGMVIFPQGRYMIYGMGLFYSSGFAMLLFFIVRKTTRKVIS